MTIKTFRKIWSRPFVACAFALPLSGCATTTIVSSVDRYDQKKNASNTIKNGTDTAVLHYAVAQSYFVIQLAKPTNQTSSATTTPGGSGSGGSAGGASSQEITFSPGAPTKGAATTPVTVKLASGGSSGGSAGADGSGSSDASECGMLQSAYASGQSAVVKEQKSYSQIVASLEAIANDPTNASDKPSDLEKTIKAYGQSLKGSYKDNFKHYQILYHNIVDKCPAAVSLTVTTTISPDPTRSFALNPKYSELFNDSDSFGVDANGFLSNGAPSSAPQAGVVLAAIASAAGTAMAMGSGFGEVQVASALIDTTKMSYAPKDRPIPDTIRALLNLPSTPTCVQNRTDLNDRQRKLATNSSLKPELINDVILTDLIEDFGACKGAPSSDAQFLSGVLLDVFRFDPTTTDVNSHPFYPGALSALPSTLLPFTIYAPLAALDLPAPAQPNAPSTRPIAPPAAQTRFEAPARTLLNFAKSSFGISFMLDCGDAGGQASETVPNDQAINGLVVSASRPCQLIATQKRNFPEATSMASAQVDMPLAVGRYWVQDSRYLRVLPAKRGGLAIRNVAYTFANGQPTGVSYTHNSETAAWVTLPATIVGAFISGITSGTSAKSSISSSQTSSIAAQTAALTAQTNYLAAQAALAAAEAKAK